MRRAFIILLSLTAGVLLASCEQPTMLSVSQTALSFENSGGNQFVTLTANKVWTASSNQGWLRVSPSSSEGTTTLSISCEGNTTYDTRTGTITIVSEELTQTISVTQTEGQGLLISQSEYNLSNEAQTISLEVQANVQYTVEIDNACKSWIKQESTKGLSSNTIKFAISKNESYDGREGKITIRQTNGNLSAMVVVKQSQTNGLFVSTPDYSLSNEKHTLTVEVNSNIEFEVEPEVDWIRHIGTKGLKSSQITLEVAANDNYDSREGKVIVKQKDGSLTGTITIKQDARLGLLLSETNFELTNDAQNISFEVKYNIPFDVVIPDGCKSWITQINTKGLESQYLSFSIAKNNTYDNREGSITIKQKDGALSGTVTIRQAQTNGLIAEKTKYEVSDKEQVLDIKVKSNIDYQVEIDESSKGWISEIQTKGLSESSVSLLIAANDSREREGKVYLKSESIQETILIIQQALEFVPILDASFKRYCVNNFDKNGDGEISIAEAKDIKSIDVNTDNITTLKGIEFFTNLLKLDCNGSTWKNGKLTSLDVSENIALERLFCHHNRITALDVSKNTALVQLDCGANNLTSLDVTSNTKLTYFSYYGNQIEFVDVSGCTKLTLLDVGSNPLTGLDVTQNLLLESLSCFYSNLSSVDVSNNVALTFLDLTGNNLTKLDVSKIKALNDLRCVSNPYLLEIWLRSGQVIPHFTYDSNVTKLYYVDSSEFGVPADIVDLGLSVKWSSWNLGASASNEYGGLYGMGDPTGKLTSRNNSEYYYKEGASICGTDYDIAHVQWKDKWRLPTIEELKELKEKCTWQHNQTVNGITGSIATGPNGNSIFIPYAGVRYESSINYRGSHASVWSGDAGGTIYNSGYKDLDVFSSGSFALDGSEISTGQTVRPVYGERPITAPELVDLGLSVKWADCNVGARSPEEYGYYFAWAEIQNKNDYSYSNYKYYTGDGYSKYNGIDNKTELDLEDDAAYMALGESWRTPSESEWKELMTECSWEWTTVNGVYGYRITSKKEGFKGNSIFLPATGFYSGTYFYQQSTVYSGIAYGTYLTTSLSTEFSFSDEFYRIEKGWGRTDGHTVRPVWRQK